MANKFNDSVNWENVIGTTYDTISVKPLRPMYIFDMLCKEKTWDLNRTPIKGDTLKFSILSAYSANTTELSATSTAINGGQVNSYSLKTVSLAPYGDYAVTDTFELQPETFLDETSDVAVNLIDQGANSVNVLAKAEMYKNQYSNGVSGTLSSTYHAYGNQTTAGSMGYLTAKDVRATVAAFRSTNVQTWGGLYQAVITPNQQAQLMADTDNSSWMESKKYVESGAIELANGDVGIFQGVRFIVNSEVPETSNTAQAIFIGKDFCGKAIGKNLQVSTNPTLHGPHHNLLITNWNALLGYKNIRRESGYIISTKADAI